MSPKICLLNFLAGNVNNERIDSIIKEIPLKKASIQETTKLNIDKIMKQKDLMAATITERTSFKCLPNQIQPDIQNIDAVIESQLMDSEVIFE